MLILLVSDERGLKDLKIERKGRLKIETTTDPEDALGISEDCEYDLVVLDHRSFFSEDVEVFEMVEKIGKRTFCMFLADGEGEIRSKFLNQILNRSKMVEGLKLSDKDLIGEDGEVLSNELSLESAFSEVWKAGDYVMKVRRDSKKKMGMWIGYQLELRKSLDFLPEYYGTIFGEVDGGEIVASFYEYVEPIKMFELSLSDLREILGMVEKAYEQGYYGIDLKLSNFGRKEGKIYYLDEKGIGLYIPPDWVELLNVNWGRKIDELMKELREK